MKKFLALALIAVVLAGLFCFSACDDKEDTSVVLTDDMTQGDIVLALYNAKSATYVPTEEGITLLSGLSIYIAPVQTVKFANNGFTQSGTSVVYDDGKLYTFDSNGYTAKEASLDDVLAKYGEYVFCFDSSTIIDNINRLSENFNLSVNNGVIEARLSISDTVIFNITDVDNTKLDIPEQYQNYKSLELTA